MMGFFGKIGTVYASETNNYEKYCNKYAKTLTTIKSKEQAINMVLKQEKFKKLQNSLDKFKKQIKEK